ncbi:MAG: DUF4157 domain-containing protein [Anaerolineae bacterium]
MSERDLQLQRDNAKRIQRSAEQNLLHTEAPLESTLGNQTMQRLVTGQAPRGGLGSFIQAKMTVNAPNDAYEQEADAVAASVVSRMHAPEVQREGEEEEELQMMPIQRQEEEEMQAMPLQRQEEEEELQMMPIQRKGSDGGFEVGGEIEQQINETRGHGSKLDDSTRSSFEGAMGYDLSGVTIHTGDHASQLSRSVEAKAFTTGSDIYFGEGQYNPGSSDGQQLLAHELTHVVQQGHSQPIQQKEE